MIAITFVMTFGQRLREWREHRGISQYEAADLVEISQPAWWSWEMDRALPRADAMFRLIAASDGAITYEMIVEAARLRSEARERARRARSGTDG